MMQGTVGEAFDISGRVVVALRNYAGSVKAGDTLLVGERSWRIRGIAIVKRVELSPDTTTDVVLDDATVAELQGLSGQPFETISDNKPGT